MTAFYQQGGGAVGGGGHHGAQPQPGGGGGEESESRVGLQHRVGVVGERVGLNEVIAHPHGVDACGVDGCGEGCEAVAQRFWTTGIVEAGDVD
jgi:hypothetical protein